MTYDKYNAPPKPRCKCCGNLTTWYDYPRRYECRYYAGRVPARGAIPGKVVGVDMDRAQALWEGKK